MEKGAIRERVWTRLEDTGVARFPFPVEGRIPNVAGAAEAAARLRDHEVWEGVDAIKANPDYAQFPVRVNALADGTDVFVAVPRLAQARCFLHLDPEGIDDLEDAATIDGAQRHGDACLPSELPTIDLVVVGSVAVTEGGARIGKGEGYSDLEFAILHECGRVSPRTPVVTTVHEHQIVDEDIATDRHDVPLDWIFTAERSIRTDADERVPSLRWELLSAADVEEMPILDRLRGDD